MSGQLLNIVIVGGGFSGTVLAGNLLRQPPEHPVRITLVERCQELGGAAYVTRKYPYLLNVPAGRMSADSRAPRSFLDFAQKRAPRTTAEDFLPRAWYGDYLRELLVDAQAKSPSHVQFERIEADAVGLARRQGDGRLRLECADGRELEADKLVLACGNPPPAQLPGLELMTAHPNYVLESCTDPRREQLTGDVLLVGTGLTMADAALAAFARGARTVHAISRHGLVPPEQVAGTHAGDGREAKKALSRATTVRDLVRVARELARNAEATGSDWRDVVNAIRELAPDIWHRLDDAQRQRFLRHVRPYWDVHRHRLPPDTAQRLAELRRSGWLQVHAGRIVEARPWGDHIRVVWRPRGTEQLAHLRVDWMLNCTGPNYDLRRTQDPLFRSAIRGGLVVPDNFGLGPRTGALGACIEASSGLPSRDVYCLGPMLRADHWEATAVAELRTHAEALAAHLASSARDGVKAGERARSRSAGLVPAWAEISAYAGNPAYAL